MDIAQEEGIDKRKHTLSIGLKVCQHIQLSTYSVILKEWFYFSVFL